MMRVRRGTGRTHGRGDGGWYDWNKNNIDFINYTN